MKVDFDFLERLYKEAMAVRYPYDRGAVWSCNGNVVSDAEYDVELREFSIPQDAALVAAVVTALPAIIANAKAAEQLATACEVALKEHDDNTHEDANFDRIAGNMYGTIDEALDAFRSC